MGAAVPLPAAPRNELAEDPLEADFGTLDEPNPAAAAEPDPFAVDFEELPADPPAPAPAPALAFGPPEEIPMAAPVSAGPDPFAMDFAEGPASPAPQADPGGDPFAMDFGSDNLEFDPTHAPKPAPQQDELEADLAAPIAAPPPGAAPTGDDLELLDFIDDAEAQARAKQKETDKRRRGPQLDGFMVRDRSGKTLGPLAEDVVIKLLSEGKLLGNEEISTDGENWAVFGSHRPFGDALQRLMEAPGGVPGLAAGAPDLGLGGSPGLDPNERIKQIYGGRMAGIVIVDSREALMKMRKRIPFFIAGGVAALVMAFGIYLGFTPYGFFGARRLFPKTIKPGSPLYAKLEEGRAELAQASYGQLQKAQAHAAEVLAENDQFIEARALYALSSFALKDQYGEASPEAISRAHAYVSEMKVANPGNPDVIEASAAEELQVGDAAALRPGLEKALAQQTSARPQSAAEIAVLLARSHAKTQNTPQAKAAFEKADALGQSHVAALVAHALFLDGQVKDPAAAAALLEKAVKEVPTHGPAALELARLRVGPLADPDHAEALLTPLQDSKELSIEEKARLHALLGMVRVYQKRLPDAEAEFKKAKGLAPKSPAVESAYAAYLLRRSNFEEAEGLFQDAYAQRPGDLDVIDGLVQSMLGRGHNLNAEKLVAEANSKFPNMARVALLQGLVAEYENKLDEAEDKYKLAISRDAKLTRADLALGRVYLRDSKLKEAHAVLEAALKKAPQDPQLITAWGEIAFAESRVDDALGLFDQALKLDNDLARTHLGRARALLTKGQLPEAQQEAELAVKQDERLAGNHRTLADVLFAEGTFDKARDQYQLAIKQDSKDEASYLGLGRSLFNLGDFDGAQTAFENSRTLNTVNYHVYFWLAVTHAKKHELTQAIELMGRAIDNGGGNDPELRYQFGLIYKQADGHYTDALDELRTALKLRPNYVDALESLGDAVLDTEDIKVAVGYFEKAFELDPKRASLMGKIGDGYFKGNQYAKAIEAYQRHIKADPNAVASYYKIGRAFDEMGKRPQAIAAYKEATQKDPNNAQAWQSLGFAYKETGKPRDAVAAFRKYLELNPKADDRKEIENELDGLGAGEK